MNIDVSFWVKGKDGAYLNEAEIEWYVSELKENDELSGFVTIVSETHRVELSDDLDYLVPKLCFSSIPDLSNNQSFSIIKASSSGSYEIHTDQQHFWVSGTNIREVAFDKGSLLIALFQCGSRFLELLRKLNGEEEKYNGTILEMEATQRIAREYIL